MIKTKGQHVNDAAKEMRISGLTVTLEPQETESFLSVLEDMMAELVENNVCSAYVFEDNPNPNSSSGINEAYNNAVSTNLAMRMLDQFGKVVPPNLARRANAAMSRWSARTARVDQITAPRRMPRGSGNNFRFSQWVRYNFEIKQAPIKCSTFQVKTTQIDDFTTDISDDLKTGETISQFTTEPTTGLKIIQTSLAGASFTFRVEIDKNASAFERIILTVTTSEGRVLPFSVDFAVTCV